MNLTDLAPNLRGERDYLLQANAALQMLPANATKWIRFERLLEVISAVEPGTPQQRPNTSRLRKLLSSAPVASELVLQQEDPFEDPFTAAITFYGGSHRVVMGGLSQGNSGCQLVLDAARGLTGGTAVDDLRRAVMAEAGVLLAISETACARADLDRWSIPLQSPKDRLDVPTAASLESLIATVTFTPPQLANLLQGGIDHLPELISPEPFELRPSDAEGPTDDRLYQYPLARLSDDRVVLALPSGVAGTIIHRALTRAVELSLQEQMSQALHAALQRSIHQSARRMRWDRVSFPEDLQPPKIVSETLWRFDVDKFAHVVGVVDPLIDYRAGGAFASADLREVEAELNDRLPVVRAAVQGKQADAQVLHLICTAQLGRSHVLGFTDDAVGESTLLVVNQDDLDIMSLTEGSETLGLWKFARASQRLHDRASVLSFSKLDEYAIYRDNGGGFYMSDDAKPTFVSVTPGSGSDLRIRARRVQDLHAVPLPFSPGFIEVNRWSADDATPIYQPQHPQYDRYRLVEIAAPCWVVPAPDGDTDRNNDLADTVAFWLWKSRDRLAGPLSRLVQSSACLTVTVHVAEQAPYSPDDSPMYPIADWLHCAREAHDQLSITLLGGASARLRGAGNDGERLLAGELVAAIHELAGLDSTGVTMEVFESLPSGPMKMFQVLTAEDDSLLMLGPASHPRLVGDADIETLLDDIGDFAARELQLRVGPVDDAEATSVLNALVGELVDRLKTAIAKLAPAYLLENLVSEQESLIYRRARDRLFLPAQAACFGERSSAVKDSLKASRDLVGTSPASRFIVECATACPPTGTESFSVASYDEMLALAKQIIEYGYVSDAIRYGLSKATVSMLPSGRIGLSRKDPYQTAISAFSTRLSDRALRDAQNVFASHWKDHDVPGESLNTADLDEAFEAEFGLSARHLADIIGEMTNIASSAQRQVAVRPHDKLVDELARQLGYEEEIVRAGLNVLVLAPITQFPDPANPVDNFPWRFSRDRSAARRPVLQRTTDAGGSELVWGPRSVQRAGSYLFEQILTARLKTRSAPMQRYVTETRQSSNAAFNRQVAELFRASGFTDVRENVKKIGRLKLARPNGNEIGDIDVLVVDNAKKILLAVEVKDFEFARTPFELSNEVAKLLEGPASAVGHHTERLKFLSHELDRVCAEWDLPGTPNGWQVQGLVVTSHDLIAMHLPQAPKPQLKIVSFENLAHNPRNVIKRLKDSSRHTTPSRAKSRRRR